MTTSPASTTQEKASAATPSSVYELRSLEVGEALQRYTQWLLEPFWPYLRGRVLEVGAGIGSIAEFYLAHVERGVLVEPAANLFASLRDKVRGFPSARPVCGFVQELEGGTHDGVSFDAASFDTAIMVNVLEHIDDHVGVLQSLHRLLVPGGKLLVFVPAMPSLYGALDARVGHVRRYTRESLVEVVRQAGFEIDTVEYFDWLGAFPWFVTGRLLQRDEVGHGPLTAYDRYVVPVCRMLDAWLEPQRFAKNLRLIARKPA